MSKNIKICLFNYLKASPLPLAHLAVAGFLVAGPVAWQYSDRLTGLLGCLVLLSEFCFASTLLLVRWFLDVSFHAICLVFAAASIQHLTSAHCFKTSGSDRSDGFRCVFFVLLNSSAEISAGSLAPGCQMLCIFVIKSQVYGAHACHLARLVPLL